MKNNKEIEQKVTTYLSDPPKKTENEKPGPKNRWKKQKRLGSPSAIAAR
jgi:hypothetical protein